MTRAERARLLDRARREGEADGRANERERMEGEIHNAEVAHRMEILRLQKEIDFLTKIIEGVRKDGEDIRAMGRALAEAVRRTP